MSGEAAKKIDKKELLFGLELFSRDKDSLLSMMRKQVMGGEGLMVVFTPNPEQVMLAQSDVSFGKVLVSADVLLPDGVGLVMASRLVSLVSGGQSVSERITGVDVANELLLRAKENGKKMLVIGGREYGDELSTLFGERVQWLEGYRDVRSIGEDEESEVQAVIEAFRPEIVFVALGAPHQERWVVEHREIMERSGVRVVMVVGGAFDVILGKLQRAPGWVQSLGLEWLYRLVQQPSRWRRQLVLIPFIGLTIKEFFRKLIKR